MENPLPCSPHLPPSAFCHLPTGFSLLPSAFRLLPSVFCLPTEPITGLDLSRCVGAGIPTRLFALHLAIAEPPGLTAEQGFDYSPTLFWAYFEVRHVSRLSTDQLEQHSHDSDCHCRPGAGHSPARFSI